MTELKDEAERTHRVVARGRDERTPFYLHLGVLIALAVIVSAVVGLVFLVQSPVSDRVSPRRPRPRFRPR